ncbi:hypothetical protein PHJA_002631900 [Phtheirospermum japonicum]|uniref:Uncharacterized protein n=1 Tax=Phtheirospermum japonicum TaxID=374723 RepID=A0A830CWC3_9LAMI|nr:hypothetical protein PHJA_002631900 [Phtheirospermum japonicum]
MATPSITSLMIDLVSACCLRSARSFNLICIIRFCAWFLLDYRYFGILEDFLFVVRFYEFRS